MDLSNFKQHDFKFFENAQIIYEQESYITFKRTFLLARNRTKTQNAYVSCILEWVGVLNSNGKDKLVLFFNETTIELRQMNQT